MNERFKIDDEPDIWTVDDLIIISQAIKRRWVFIVDIFK